MNLFLLKNNIMKNFLIPLFITFCFTTFSQSGSEKLNNIMPIRGFCIAAPQPDDLEEFVKFIDETPDVKMPEKYVWPNDDGLYCKSYCPLHPELHKVVFTVVDEICDVFEADAFHAGMDEGDNNPVKCFRALYDEINRLINQ